MSWPTPKFHIKWTTRDFVKETASILEGSVLDFGGGTQKYRKLIEVQPRVTDYKVFDCIQIPGVDFVGDAHATELANDQFDAIVCTQVLEHVERPWDVVAEMARITKPGGKLVLSVPFMIGYHPCPNDYYRFTVKGTEYICSPYYECDSLVTYGGISQILAASDAFSHTYNYENFMKIEEQPDESVAEKASKRFRSAVYSLAERVGLQPSIYSNIGCVLIKR